jgi:large subunit ribosomal protein L24
MQFDRKGSKKVRKGDKVRVRCGNAKGQVGTVAMCLGDRVVVEGVNLCKKHVKRSQQHTNGGRVDIERPIHVSNVTPCDEAGNPVKLQVKKNAQGVRELTYMKEGQQVMWRSIKGSKK